MIDQLVSDGNKIIFATSFGYQPAMDAASKKYPDVKFEMATGYITHKNMAVYYGAGEDAIYLSGIAAGAATKSGTVGYVVPFAIPEVIRHTNAFALGVQKAHPGAKVKIIWTNSWFAPDKEKKAAETSTRPGRRDRQNVDSPRRTVRRVRQGARGSATTRTRRSSRRTRGSPVPSTTGVRTTRSGSRPR